ncbi:MAG: TIM-barrel domain-containing protein, partial [Terriglobia bacterium]
MSVEMTRRKAVALLGATSAGIALGAIPTAAQTGNEPARRSALSVMGRPAEMWLTPVSPYTLRISLLAVLPNGPPQGKVQLLPESIVLASATWPAPAAKLRSIARTEVVRWGSNSLSVLPDSQKRLRLVARTERKIIQQVALDCESGAVRFSTGDLPVFGLGEGGSQFDRRGAEYSMKHGEGVPNMRTDGARLPIPWLIGTEGWALFFHLPLGTFDLTGKDGVFQPRPGADLPLDFFLIVADEPAQILAEYARLTGFPHMPPAWALGYQQSHRTLASREEVMGEAATFRQKQLPCDALIYLGTGFCPSGWNKGHGSYDFNPAVFPDPAPMIDEMHREHFKIVLHEDKPPKQLHGRAGDSGPAAEDPEDAAYYWKEHLKVFNLGVDGWWADEGDWLDDVSCLVRNRMYWEGSQLARPNVRPYTLNRNGYAGIQRYGWLWSGDITSTWETLRNQVAVGINTGLSGMPYWGTDTGGFSTTPELTGELYVRWFQFSAFCPLFRSHGRTWKLRLPWGWDTG